MEGNEDVQLDTVEPTPVRTPDKGCRVVSGTQPESSNTPQTSACSQVWLPIQKYIEYIAFDPFSEILISLAIGLNILSLTADYDGIEGNPALKSTLNIGNMISCTILGIGVALRIVVMCPKLYFRNVLNVFDMYIAIVAVAELICDHEDLPGIVLVRVLRTFCIFGVAKYWKTFNLIVHILYKVFRDLLSLFLVLILVTFSFAILGMAFFSKDYTENVHLFKNKTLPVLNFTDFPHSLVVVFGVLCGDWMESMWTCVLVSGWTCTPFFVLVVVIGNLIMLNLFLALLLSSFGHSNIAQPFESPEGTRLIDGFKRIGQFNRWIFTVIRQGLLERSVWKTSTNDEIPEKISGPDLKSLEMTELHSAVPHEIGKNTENVGVRVHFADVGDTVADSDDNQVPDVESSENENVAFIPTNEIIEDEDAQLEDCFPPIFYNWCPIFSNNGLGPTWRKLRLASFELVDGKYFEIVIFTLIILSSLALVFEDTQNLDKTLFQEILSKLDILFGILFTLELLLKWFGLGLRKYFSIGWYVLDFVIVIPSVLYGIWRNTFSFDAFPVVLLKLARLFRALRPLRILSRLQGLRVLVNALVQGIPLMSNVFGVCVLFWHLFALMGVQLYKGKFYKCLNSTEIPPILDVVADKEPCLAANLTWVNSMMNFDHVGNAYLSLLQVATFKGWMPIVRDAVASYGRGVDFPSRAYLIGTYVYFVVFIIFGAFYTIHLFIGVMIDSYNEQRRKAGGALEMFMTRAQLEYYHALKNIGDRKPIKKFLPKTLLQKQTYDVVTHNKFELVMLFVIALHLVTMTVEHYGQTQIFLDVKFYANVIFTLIFSMECVLKIFAFRQHYFVNAWNWFDLIVVSFSVIAIALPNFEIHLVSPGLLRILRFVKVRRALRHVQGCDGVRTLSLALSNALPSVLNTCVFFLVIMFTFALVGISVELSVGLEDLYNFNTFGSSMILLLQMSTSAGWDTILRSILNQAEQCAGGTESQTCSSSAVGITFVLSYLLIAWLIVTNLFIAIIFENYSHAKELVEEELTDDVYDTFFETWADFDPGATQYIRLDQLSSFLDTLDAPFCVKKPNKFKIALMDVAICEGDLVHFAPILEAVTKDFFYRKWTEFDPVAEECSNHGALNVVSSTLWRTREECGAKIIQTAWRSYKNHIGKSYLPKINFGLAEFIS